MKTKKHSILTGNQVVARIAYKTNEICPIYPITPASEMSELVEQWSSEKQKNIFGTVPTIVEMQSEAGVAGTMHGALQTGSLTTTFTASQGLLLMMPNMYKIAGELTPNVIHVATRSIATHALSIFGDHSDIMAVRSTGYAMLGAASVQEAQDFALIAQAATLKSRIPFIHFFDGFRTSHEINTIETISDETIKAMMDSKQVQMHRNRALNPNNPSIKGTSQEADVFFQSREAANTFYKDCHNIVQNTMDTFKKLTGRAYKLFDYIGHKEAEYVLISMASSTKAIEETINYCNSQGEKYGLIKVRLFRPFSTNHLIESLPSSVKSIAVLDRTKEPGTIGEPLYLDVVQSISEAFQNNKINKVPLIIGGRYGLASKEFNPGMVKAVFDNLKKSNPKNHFTVGILDDVTHSSLPISNDFEINSETYEVIFYQNKPTNKGLTELIGNTTNNFVQSYTKCDYNKFESKNIEHLRISKKPINKPYLINRADFMACHHEQVINNEQIIKNIKPNGILLVNSSQTSKAFWQALSSETQESIINNSINLYVVNIENLKPFYELRSHTINALQACFLVLKEDLILSYVFNNLYQHIHKVDTTIQTNYKTIQIGYDEDFTKTLLGKLLADKGNEVPVSQLPVDGTYPSNSSQYNVQKKSSVIPEWHPDLCTQCGACSMACPQGAIRMKVFEDAFLESVPTDFKFYQSKEFDLLNYTIQINSDQCNSCNNCLDACPAKALTLTNKTDNSHNWNYFESLPEFDRSKINIAKVSQQQLQEPLFKYATGIAGCGEAPYIKLLSQLFGGRLLVANATGASSIFGGALPTTPWSKNIQGKGPAWSNSLFEDNAELGLGFRLSLNQQEKQAKELLTNMSEQLDHDLVSDIFNASQDSETEIIEQATRVQQLKLALKLIETTESNSLYHIADSLIKKSVWCIGGDGWAYDIGYGGIDHVLASGENVNMLVLDNQIYDNTGGQASKATPVGAAAKFEHLGKRKQKKDLGLLAMTYDNVYVASVAIGANQEQTLKAFVEAEQFNGPSIIIAYCHSESHGIDMKHPSQYHKAAVNSGQWVLYRNNPNRALTNKSALQLDSEVPSIKVEEYLKMEKRFSKLLNNNPSEFRLLMKQIQKQIDNRYNTYLLKASYGKINRAQLLQNMRIRKQLNYN